MHHNLFNQSLCWTFKLFPVFALINKAVMSVLVHQSSHPLQIASLGPKGCILFKKGFSMSITTFPEVTHFLSSSKMVKQTKKIKFKTKNFKLHRPKSAGN